MRIRLIVFTFIALGALSALAQDQTEFRIATIDGTSIARKPFLSALQIIDGAALASVEGDHAKVRLSLALPVQEFLNALLASGAGAFRSTDPTGEIVRSSTPIPVYIDTGDPVADEERFAAAKQAWRLEHPEAFREYMRTVRTHALYHE